MSKLGKIIGRACLSTLTASLIPYCIKKDEETGGFEVDAVLWSVKKIPGEEKDKYVFELLPLFGKKKGSEEEAEAPAETPVPEELPAEPEAPADPA